MADTDVLSLGVTADVAQFLKNMGEVQTKIATTLEGMKNFGDASKKAGADHAASATSIGLSVVSWQAVAGAAREAVRGLVEFGEASIEAANVIDPSGATKWNEAVDNLKDSFTRFAGAIGKELRPAVEGAMEKVSEVFAKLSRMNWGEVGQHILNVLKDVAGGIKSWATDVLEVLTFPFRIMVSVVEDSLGKVMQIIGKAATALGGTSIGKKLGLNEFSGDAFSQTGADMQKQAATIAGSLSGAMSEVGKGLSAGIDAALAKLGENPDVKAILSAYKNASGKPVANVNDAKDIALINGAMLQQEQVAKLYDRVMGKSAAEQLRVSMQDLELTRQRADLQKGAADYEFQQALGDKTNAFSSYDAAVSAAAKVRDAYQASTNALKQELTASQTALKKQQDDQFNAELAVEQMREKADAALEANKNKNLAAEARATNDGVIAEYQLRLQQANQARMFAQQSEQMVGQKRMEIEKSVEDARMDALKREQQLRQKQAEMLTSITSKIGGVTGTVGGAAGSAIAAGAGPVGVAAAVGQSLLENSAGFKKVQDAINGIMQKVADTVGRVLEPLVPIIKSIGDALSPLLDAIGSILAAGGANLAAALKPLGPLITALSKPLIALAKPVVDLLQSIEPLIGPIVQVAALITEVEMMFDPLILALRVLGPEIEFVAKVISFVVDGIKGIWNGILETIASVLDTLAHVLPSKAGDAMRDLYYQVQKMEIGADAFDTAATDAKQVIDDLKNGTKELTQAQHAAAEAYIAQEEAAAKYLALLGQADAAQQIANDAAANQKLLDDATAANTQATTTNTQSNKDATRATRDLIATLTNTPTGFRVGGYEYGAAGGPTGPLSSGAGGHAVIVGGAVTINVHSGDPEKAGADVLKTLAKHAYKSGGVGFGTGVDWS